MSDLRKAAQQALEALENPWRAGADGVADAITALRAALAQPESFNPDWDRVKALEESLREHMAEIQRLKALAQPEPLTDELTRAITQCNSWWGIKCKEMLASEREAFVAIINDNTDGDGICCADDLLAASRAHGIGGEHE